MNEERDVEELLRRGTAGQGHDLGHLIERTLPGLHAYVARHLDYRTASKESVSDVVQSACREVIQGFGAFDYQGELPFRSYLYRTARSKVIDRRRYYDAEKRDPAMEVPLQDGLGDAGLARERRRPPSPEELALRREELEKLEKAWGALPHELREILTLRRIYGLSNREAADRLGMTEARAKHLMGRALTRLTLLFEE